MKLRYESAVANDNGDEEAFLRTVDPDRVPDVRDGLTRKERIVLKVLHDTQRERNGRNVPMLQLYGRVIEHIDMSQGEMMAIVRRLIGTAGRAGEEP